MGGPFFRKNAMHFVSFRLFRSLFVRFILAFFCVCLSTHIVHASLWLEMLLCFYCIFPFFLLTGNSVLFYPCRLHRMFAMTDIYVYRGLTSIRLKNYTSARDKLHSIHASLYSCFLDLIRLYLYTFAYIFVDK